MKTLILENNWLDKKFMEFGWGNGYVIIPKGHVLHGVDYNSIDVDAHGGLTYSELITEKLIENINGSEGENLSNSDLGSWMVGFDTVHYKDTLLNWSKQDVKDETERLFNQLLNYKKL